MKLFIAFLILFPLSIFAQRVNEHGLKMVSEIEYTSRDQWVTLFKFRYDEKNRLSQMTVYRKWIYSDARIKDLNEMSPQNRKEHLQTFPAKFKLHRDFIKMAEGLTVKDYDSYNYSPLRWEVAFDCYGNISRISVFEEFAPSAIKRDEFNFEYERDGINNTFRLSRYSGTETSKRKGQKSWYGTTVGTLYSDVFYYDGFIKLNSYPKYFETYKKEIDYDHINDTNINLLYFMGEGGLYGGGMNMAYFTLTEWLNCRSKYFMKVHSEIMEYKYTYDDSGNISVIEEWEHWNNKDYLEGKVKINYLE